MSADTTRASLRERIHDELIDSVDEELELGGLACYGANFADTQRLVGVYTGHILKGENPGDLPVQQATKTELVIKTKRRQRG
jgi:ABC-type uncharacterized transport system substrate-binding protein